MFKRVSNFDWRPPEVVRLRVARLRTPMRADPEYGAPVSLPRALWRRTTRTTRRLRAISGLFRRLIVPGSRKRD
jgi:hypothetical protein